MYVNISNMTLYEYFNTTKQTSPHFERHENFVSDIKLPTCALVQTLPYNLRCDYVRRMEQCLESVYCFNYIDLLYCQINAHDPIVMGMGIALLFLISAYIFLILGITADQYFCPSLQVLSHILSMNENVAGVTLLAFGNGAPDLFTSFAGLSGESRRLFSDLFGATLFVVFLVGGVIVTVMPFRVQATVCLRDICFLLLDVLYIDYAIQTDHSVTLIESIMILLIYLAYIIVIIIDQSLLIRSTRAIQRRLSIEPTIDDTSTLRNLRQEGVLEIYYKNDRRESIDLESMHNEYDSSHGPNFMLFTQFFRTINPIDKDEWANAKTLGRFYILLNLPIKFVLRLIIPIVDYELPNQGWCKLLNCLQIITIPSLVCYTTVSDLDWIGMPICIWILIATVPLAVIIFAITRSDSPPSQYKFLSILGLGGSVFVIHACANELVSVLEVIGITSNRSNSFIGCTLLAWGNSMGDLMANYTLARLGYPKMSFAACFGGPLFNTLLVIGSVFTYNASKQPNYKYVVGEGTMGVNTTVFIAIGLSCIIFAVTATNFILRRSIGVFMIFIYLLYFSYTLMGELEYIHTYGSDHSMDLIAETTDVELEKSLHL